MSSIEPFTLAIAGAILSAVARAFATSESLHEALRAIRKILGLKDIGEFQGHEEVASTESKVEVLRENLAISGQLIAEIEAEFALQIVALDRIKAEAEENQRLAELNKTEADAVRLVITTAQTQAAKPSRRQQWLFFLAGLFFSIPLGVGVNFLYDMIAH